MMLGTVGPDSSLWGTGAPLIPRGLRVQGWGASGAPREELRRRCRYWALTCRLWGKACHLASVPGVNVPERSLRPQNVSNGNTFIPRRLGQACGVWRCGYISALKRRVLGWQGRATPLHGRAWAAPDKRVVAGVCGGQGPLGLRRPAWTSYGVDWLLHSVLKKAAVILGGPRSWRMAVRLALGPVMVPGVWLQGTQTQLLACPKGVCIDSCNALPSGTATSRPLASEIKVLLLLNVLTSAFP